MAAKSKETESEAAQTAYRESESQYLEWDTAEAPSQHPSNFPRGRGLWYPILYNPAWPVHIAARKKDQKLPPASKKDDVIGSYTLTGMTLSERERRPITKTLIFPHRNTDHPFRQPLPKVVKDPVYEPCETLTLTAVEELESKVIYKTILEKIPQHNENDKSALQLAIRKAFHMNLKYMDDPRPPISCKKTKHQYSKIKAKEEPKIRKVDEEPLEIIVVDEGLYCGIHGPTIDISIVKNCQIHGNSGIINEGEFKEVPKE